MIFLISIIVILKNQAKANLVLFKKLLKCANVCSWSKCVYTQFQIPKVKVAIYLDDILLKCPMKKT